MKEEYWTTNPYCYCKNLSWGSVDDIVDVPAPSDGFAFPGLTQDESAILGGALAGLAALLLLLPCLLCCLCPPGFCCGLCPWMSCLGGAAGAKAGAGAHEGGAGGAGGAGAARAGRLHEVDIKLPRAWVESFRGVPIEDFDAKLKALESSGWVGLNDYGSWYGDDTNSMTTLVKGDGMGGYGAGYGAGYEDEVDHRWKKGHNRSGSAYITSKEVFGTRHDAGTASVGERAEKNRDYDYGSIISAKYGNDVQGVCETDIDRATSTTLLRNPESHSDHSGGIYNYGYSKDEEIRMTTTTTTSQEQEEQTSQQQLQQTDVATTGNSGMKSVSEISMSSGYNTLRDGTLSRRTPMASTVIYEATRETRTVTDESGNVSKTHSETKNGDGAKVLGVISKNGTFRRMKNGEVEFMTPDDISKDVKCLTRENVMKLYQSYQRAANSKASASNPQTSNATTTFTITSQNTQDKDKVSL